MNATDKRIAIGIAGGTGSGKSTLAAKLAEIFGKDAATLCCDCYYKDEGNLSFAERCKINYDCPEALDTDLLAKHIAKLKQGEEIFHPMYDFSTHTRLGYAKIESKKITVVEGILLFQSDLLLTLFDLKIYVDTDEEIRLKRRINRDVSERGRTKESVLAQYYSTVKPMHEKYVEPSKSLADVVVRGDGELDNSAEIIAEKIRRLM